MIKIITDTTSCLPNEFASQHAISIIPQVINFGNDTYLEGQQLSIDEFMTRLKSSSSLPKTAAPPPELFKEEFEKFIPQVDSILCIHPSTEVSGTVRSAFVAAADFPDADIRIIDTRTIGSGLCSMVMLAAQWAENGKEVDTIIDGLTNLIKRNRVYFLVSTLEYLAKGGRIGGAQALLGSVLQIKPILMLNNGRVDQYEKARTQKHAVNRLKEIVAQQATHDGNAYLTVMHAGVPKEAEVLAKELGELINQPKVEIYAVPPAIVTHGGPGILATSFFTA